MTTEPLLPRLIALLKTDQTPELDGFFLVNLRLSRENSPTAAGLRWRKFPGGQPGAVITHAFGDRSLRAVLLQPREGDGLPKNADVANGTPVAELRFSADEVETFVRETGDENPNHRGDGAVVPGLLLARTVEALLRDRSAFGDEFEFRFLESLSLNKPLFLIRETNTRWVGQSAARRRVLELAFPQP